MFPAIVRKSLLNACCFGIPNQVPVRKSELIPRALRTAGALLGTPTLAVSEVPIGFRA